MTIFSPTAHLSESEAFPDIEENVLDTSQALPTRHMISHQAPKNPSKTEKAEQQKRSKNTNQIGLLPTCNKLGGLACPLELPRLGV
jgi:hypothetical protein